MGDYYRTYPVTVEAEVTAALNDPGDFFTGPRSLFRDSPSHIGRGFIVRDGSYLSARWPGDIHRYIIEMMQMLSRTD
jgi:protease I